MSEFLLYILKMSQFLLFAMMIKIFSFILSRQSLGGAKTGDPREKTPARRTWLLSLVTQARLEPTAVRWQAI